MVGFPGGAVDGGEVAEMLREGGIRFLGWDDGVMPIIPASVALRVASCKGEDNRRDVMLSHSDPLWRSKANSFWYEFATVVGLFDRNGEFLVGVAPEPETWPVLTLWAKVGLSSVWDVAGKNAPKILGGPYTPEFVMVSLDGKVIVRGTTWQDAIGFIAVLDPGGSRYLRQEAEELAAWELADPRAREAARRWLTRMPGDSGL